MKTGVILIATFLSLPLFVLSSHLSTTKPMASNMDDCPFMLHEESICPMDFADHIYIWKSVFVGVLPTILTIISILSLVVIKVRFIWELVLQKAKTPAIRRQYREATYSFLYRPLQEMFSSGILNPKLH